MKMIFGVQSFIQSTTMYSMAFTLLLLGFHSSLIFMHASSFNCPDLPFGQTWIAWSDAVTSHLIKEQDTQWIHVTNRLAVYVDVAELKLPSTMGIHVDLESWLCIPDTQNVYMEVAFLIVNGRFTAGSEVEPFQHQFNLVLTQPPRLFDEDGDPAKEKVKEEKEEKVKEEKDEVEMLFHEQAFGRKVLGVGREGVVGLHGRKGRGESWGTLARTARPGDARIYVAAHFPIGAVGDSAGLKTWQSGDRIVLASTDFNMLQAEEVELIDCDDATSKDAGASPTMGDGRGPSTLMFCIRPALSYMHFGEFSFDGLVDERAEVGLLSRSIQIQGLQIDDFNDQSFGGHVMVRKGGTLHLEAVQLHNMAQGNRIGRYPVHFHMAIDGRQSYVKDCSITKSAFRCITIHGTDGVVIQGNVAYDHFGHCIITEDGVEQSNVFQDNLVLSTRRKRVSGTGNTGKGFVGFASDSLAPSSYWITNPLNDFVGNVAAGSQDTGFWFTFRSGPSGDSQHVPEFQGRTPRLYPLGRFVNNKAHSAREYGLTLEPRNHHGLQGIFDNTGSSHDALFAAYEPQDVHGRMVEIVIEGFTCYKAFNFGAWLRGEQFRVTQASFANNGNAITFATSGTHPKPHSYGVVERSTIGGQSANVGTRNEQLDMQWTDANGYPFYGTPIHGRMVGFVYYDGPMFIRDSSFYGFRNQETTPTHARCTSSSDFVGQKTQTADSRKFAENEAQCESALSESMCPLTQAEWDSGVARYFDPSCTCEDENQLPGVACPIGCQKSSSRDPGGCRFCITKDAKQKAMDEWHKKKQHASNVHPTSVHWLADGVVCPSCVCEALLKKEKSLEAGSAWRNAANGFYFPNVWQTATTNHFENVRFSSDSKPIWLMTDRSSATRSQDGDTSAIAIDRDGSLTGYARAAIVNNLPYLTSPGCLYKEEWRATVCRLRYANLWIENMDTLRTQYGNVPDEFNQVAMTLIRDQHSPVGWTGWDKNSMSRNDDQVDIMRQTLQGITSYDGHGHKYLFQTMIVLGASYTMHFPHATPPKLRIQISNADEGDNLRVGICYPPGTTNFYVSRGKSNSNLHPLQDWGASHINPVVLIRARSLDDSSFLHGEAYYWDATARLLFIQLKQKNARWNSNYCPEEGCEDIIVEANVPVGSLQTSGDCSFTAYPKYSASVENLGGGVVQVVAPKDIVATSTPIPTDSEHNDRKDNQNDASSEDDPGSSSSSSSSSSPSSNANLFRFVGIGVAGVVLGTLFLVLWQRRRRRQQDQWYDQQFMTPVTTDTIL